MWEYLRLDHISKVFKGGLDYGMLYENGLLSYEPLKKYLEAHILENR